MKKLIIITGLCTLTALAGCAKDMGNRDVYEESGNTINVNNKRNDLYNESAKNGMRNESSDYGYVRHQKSPILNANPADDHYAAIDREQLANIISKFSANIPNVNDVATLVTDQEVLISYLTDSKDRDLTADQVKRTGISVVPRWYHVYVTDNKALMRDVENLASLDSRSGTARSAVQQVIKEMKKSPQGYKISNSEDENGLTPSDYNRGMNTLDTNNGYENTMNNNKTKTNKKTDQNPANSNNNSMNNMNP